MKGIAIDALIAAGVLTVLLSVLGMMRMRDAYQQMHYLAAPASLSAAFFTIAIFLQEGLKPEGFKAILVTLILVAMNSIVTHEASRAFRISEFKEWHAKEGEEVPMKSTDELVPPEPNK